MFLWHANRCAICGDWPHTVIDHDHETGLVRGLLCVRCNRWEGLPGRRDHPVFTRYRKYPPAFLLQVEIRYTTRGDWRYSTYRGG